MASARSRAWAGWEAITSASGQVVQGPVRFLRQHSSASTGITLDGLIRSGAWSRAYFHDEPKAYQANIDRNRAVLLTAMEEAIKAARQTARTEQRPRRPVWRAVRRKKVNVYANHRKART